MDKYMKELRVKGKGSGDADPGYRISMEIFQC